MLLPVRGSATPGKLGLSSLKLKPLTAEGLGACHCQQPLLQLAPVHDRDVGRGIRAAGDAGLDLAQRDLVGDPDRGVEPGAAGALHGDAGGERRESRRQRHFAPEVPIGRMLDHGAERDLAQLHPAQPKALHQGADRLDRHAEVTDVGIDGVVAAERDADPADDAGATDAARGHVPPLRATKPGL